MEHRNINNKCPAEREEDSKPDNGSGSTTQNDDDENARKIAAFVRGVLRNEIPKEKVDWPLCLLIEHNRSVRISQQDFQNMVTDKVAEVMATKSQESKQMAKISICKDQQRLYYKKYKHLLSQIHTLNSELDSMDRVPDPVAKHVRNVGVGVNLLKKKK